MVPARAPVVHVVSMSGGKDSTATALLCRELHDPETIRYVFADTGNEHPLTCEYLDYLQDRLNAPIDRLKVDFTARLERKATYVATHWRRSSQHRRTDALIFKAATSASAFAGP